MGDVCCEGKRNDDDDDDDRAQDPSRQLGLPTTHVHCSSPRPPGSCFPPAP